MKKEFKLGTKLRCTITGFEGIATSRIEYINGCIQFGMRQKVDKDGKLQDVQYFDSQQLEEVGEGVSIVSEKTGGPSDAPRSSRFD